MIQDEIHVVEMVGLENFPMGRTTGPIDND